MKSAKGPHGAPSSWLFLALQRIDLLYLVLVIVGGMLSGPTLSMLLPPPNCTFLSLANKSLAGFALTTVGRFWGDH